MLLILTGLQSFSSAFIKSALQTNSFSIASGSTSTLSLACHNSLYDINKTDNI